MPDAKAGVSEVGVAEALRMIQGKRRYLYTPEQVNFIRESFLIEKKKLAWIMENVWPPASENALYKIATGKAYSGVPLSPRLAAAYEAQELKRTTSIAGPGAGSGAADPVRADELLEESEPDWG